MSVYDPEAFSERVTYARKCIVNGHTDGRAFDTCFEMNDGDAVGVALYRRSLNDPYLAARLFIALHRATIMESVETHKDVPTSKLPDLARSMRTGEYWKKLRESKVAHFPLQSGQANLYVYYRTHIAIASAEESLSFDLEEGDNVMSMRLALKYAGYLERLLVRYGIQSESGEWIKSYNP